jgi:integrase
MASLVARHSRKCALGGKELAAPEIGDLVQEVNGVLVECTCKPQFGARFRDNGRNRFEKLGYNRKEALPKLRKLAVQLDEGEAIPQGNIKFAEWGAEWRDSLEAKETTVDGYGATIDYATKAFGGKVVRKLQPSDVAEMNKVMKDAGLSESTRAKHLRVLNGCIESAIAHGYAAQNPVKRLPKNERPKPSSKEAAYFTNDEVPRLFTEIPEGVWRTVFLVALKTGMREGELVALTWGNIDQGEKLIRVRRTFSHARLTAPKTKSSVRDVNYSEDVLELFGDWWPACGKPNDDALIFAAETGGYLEDWRFTKSVLYPAMERAGIPRVGETGEARTFHSLRHTFAKRALESGRQITWLSRHLGHSSLKVTTDIYGHWERATAKAEAQQMEGVFGV